MRQPREIEIEKVDLAKYLHPKIKKIDGGCWLWTGKVAGGGYGRVYTDIGEYTAHRLSYVEHRGPIPDGMVLDHLCRIRSCVNPDHLDPVTQDENIRRGLSHVARNRWASGCPIGHPYDGENLYVHNGHRHCRACRTELNQTREPRFRRVWIVNHAGSLQLARVPRFVGAIRHLDPVVPLLRARVSRSAS